MKSPLSSLRPSPSSCRTPSAPSRSSLSIARSTVSRRPAFSSPASPIASITPSSTLRLLTLMTYWPRSKSQRLHRIRRHHADLGVGGDARRAHRVRIELHELAKASRPRLFVPKHPAGAIAAIRFWQRVEILRDVAGERRGQVVAERQPRFVLVLEGEHALVRAVLVGQEFSERLGVFDERRLAPARSRSARRPP